MPQQTDVAKGPLEILGGAKAWAKGDYEKGVLTLVNSAGFAGFAFGRYFAKDTIKKAFGEEMVWLWRGIVFIMCLQMLLGSATENGEKHKSAKKDFQLAYKSLEAAEADDRGWTGDAADAYNEQNDRQMTRADTIAELDSQIAAILKTESEQVKRTALNLNWEQAALTTLIPICHLLNRTQPQVSQTIQMCAFFAAVDAGVAIISWMAEMSHRNRGDIDASMEKYRQVADEAEASLRALLDDAAVGAIAPATKSTVGQFDTLGTAAPLAASASVSTVADELPAAGVVGPEKARGSEGPAEPAEGEPPAYAVPTMSQVVSRASRASAQAAQFSEDASVHVSLVSDTVGVVDQINSMAQSGAPAAAAPAAAAAPTEEAAVGDDAVAEDGAIAGTEGAERAPIEAGATEQAQEPNPAVHTL